MSLSDADHDLVVEELGREPTQAEAALFENLWSEHCAYRSSRPLLGAFDSEGDQVVVGPGDDAAVVALPGGDGTYITMGIESHNHPSYVDPFDGAATGVGGIVRDTLSMGAYPIALADSLYFGDFDREHSRYLLEGVVEGISHYGNCIGVPTVTGSAAFHEDYEGNPLVNVSCIGLVDEERMITAEAQQPGNKLVLVGNSTGRDGLGGASFASEDLAEDAETEDRPAVQVGDPYTEKLLIEANEQLIDEGLIESARDLGAAGLGGASSELVAKGGLGAEIELTEVHEREPNMNAMEYLLAESQERMCYEVAPENVDRVKAIAERFDLGASVIGEVTDTGDYVCTFEGETVVDCDAEFLGEGAPFNDLPAEEPTQPERDLPEVALEEAFEAVVASPNTASKRWIYRQYDHEVQVRTATPPGDDAAVLAIREAGAEASDDDSESGVGLAYTAGADPNWTDTAPYEGARAVALENATNLAAKGTTPLAAVDCLNGGNPEKPDVYGAFKGIVDGLADMCSTLDVPVVGGNVSLYNDSVSGPIPPTPTLAMVGTKDGYDAPPLSLSGEGDLLLVGARALEGDAEPRLGGSEYLGQFGGSDRFPTLLDHPDAFVDTLADVADDAATLATHDLSHGGLAAGLAEMVHEDGGASVEIDATNKGTGVELLFGEQPGRVVIETTDARAVREAFDGVAPVYELGSADDSGRLDLTIAGESLRYDAETIADLRSIIADELA
ncbi:phosphoribosylformylglycinamidine synthase subunit PurL [Halomicrobium mukohataei]|uniref:Phosphoribosylformylglycinamidine synthase subunit PurL n=1 Tax=Halomicrobium mukohataei TaxID=57705 RepID=A0A847UGP5_9EURY|nr:phosphoribosylformylglycinamidine synthase subunit PurL [Halomicrobium mukohataei]NLV10268.1 phosphoribosylformylglycinamidine synthase subunit PurL [Halomicrobium mukohataei]